MIRKPGGQGFFKGMWGLDLPGVKEWLFCPGMLFQAKGKWWGDRGPRRRPHEGLDLLLYRDQEGRVFCLNETTQIPAMSDGVVVGIIHDFLGKSVIVEHPLPDRNAGRLYSIYGHTRPTTAIGTGTAVSRGDIIATVASPGRPSLPMAPHLHISMAWSPQAIACDRLNWDTLGVADTLTLLDPLSAVACPYRILGNNDPACGAL